MKIDQERFGFDPIGADLRVVAVDGGEEAPGVRFVELPSLEPVLLVHESKPVELI